MDNLDRWVDAFADEVPSLLTEHNIPGMAVGICDATTVLWAAGFGTIQRNESRPVMTSTMFSVQSGTKMYTATAVMLAIQDGLVDLDEPVTSYLPEFTVRSRWESQPERRITLRHLLSHTAGFTHEAPLGGNLDQRDGSFEEHCRSIADTWLRFPVGNHFEYSNLGYDLAAYVLQRVHRENFADIMHRTLFEPLGLHRTTVQRVLGQAGVPVKSAMRASISCLWPALSR
jgi:CubicO group peptidase (beta-lactamase class C family)